MSSVNAISSDWFATTCAPAPWSDFAERVDDADPRQREVAVPVNLHVREVERIGAQHPEVGHVDGQAQRNERCRRRDRTTRRLGAAAGPVRTTR